jgi:hypothetical protein
MNVYRTLLATRARIVDFRHVEALNMIDIEFSSKSPEDAAVRNAWKDYLDALNDTADFNSPAKIDKRRDLLAELLQRMGRALNYEFDFAYLKRRAYYPQVHEDEAQDNYNTRKKWLETLDGTRPLKMEVSAPNPHQTGIASN